LTEDSKSKDRIKDLELQLVEKDTQLQQCLTEESKSKDALKDLELQINNKAHSCSSAGLKTQNLKRN